jgi:hypothetical protein
MKRVAVLRESSNPGGIGQLQSNRRHYRSVLKYVQLMQGLTGAKLNAE